MDPRNLPDWIALNMLPGLGPIALHRALKRYGDPAEIAFKIPPGAFQSLARCPPAPDVLADTRRGLRRRAERELKRCRRLGVRLLAWTAPDYPAVLRE